MPRGIYPLEKRKGLFKKGHKPIPLTEKGLNRIREVHTGVVFKEQRKINISNSLKGRILSKEWKDKISMAHIGKKLTFEHKQKIARKGELNGSWKGGISKSREHRNNKLKEWRSKNPLKVKAEYHKRRNATRDLTVETVQSVYEENIKKFGTLTCYLCLKAIEFGKDTLEHKNPLSRGGSNEYDNLGVACRICNCKKASKTVEEFLK